MGPEAGRGPGGGRGRAGSGGRRQAVVSLQAYMEDHLRNRDRLAKEWQALCAYQAEPNTCATAQGEGNIKKNRHPDFLSLTLVQATLISHLDRCHSLQTRLPASKFEPCFHLPPTPTPH